MYTLREINAGDCVTRSKFFICMHEFLKDDVESYVDTYLRATISLTLAEIDLRKLVV